VVQMDSKLCKDCPLRSQCVDGKGPRTLTVRDDEAKVQAKRVEQQSESWQVHYRERSRVEHVNKELTAHGGRDARYYGVRKTEGQLRLCASVHNIMEIGRVKRARTMDSRTGAGEKCA